MPDDFAARIDELAAKVGTGDLVGEVGYDQVYAHYQHVHVEFRHPRGGQALYLSAPLAEGTQGFMQQLADGLLDNVRGAMIGVCRDLAETSAALTPIEIGDLRESAQYNVTDDGATIVDQPPIQPRLSEQELRDKARILRDHGDETSRRLGEEFG